jgi:hypothetical protein
VAPTFPREDHLDIALFANLGQQTGCRIGDDRVSASAVLENDAPEDWTPPGWPGAHVMLEPSRHGVDEV